jgi:hypothetical protein
MRRKTSVSLTEELLDEIEFLERAGWDRIALLKRRKREERDRRILDGKARALNSEALDVLEYQAGG